MSDLSSPAHMPTVTPAGSYNTASRAADLARAAVDFPELGATSSDILLALVEAELGHPQILDDYQTHGRTAAADPENCEIPRLFSRAIAPECILHIVAGNTPVAGLQSLLRGLLLGSHNLVKLPTGGLPDLDRFVAALPAELQARVKLSTSLEADWMRRAHAVIVFGDDDTVHHFRKAVRSNQVFVAHGHRISLGVLFLTSAEELKSAATLAARDVSLYDQQGCLSPHNLYVEQSEQQPDAAKVFAEHLAAAMAEYQQHDPRSRISPAAAAEISALRDSYRFRAASDDRVALWQSEGDDAWTVIYESDPQFAVSPLHRTVFVKPVPEGGIPSLSEELRLIHRYMSSIALHPFTPGNARRLAHLPASRLCPLGAAQQPHPFWHQDARPQLAPLVTWQDIG